jgi:hypothetical protein
MAEDIEDGKYLKDEAGNRWQDIKASQSALWRCLWDRDHQASTPEEVGKSLQWLESLVLCMLSVFMTGAKLTRHEITDTIQSLRLKGEGLSRVHDLYTQLKNIITMRDRDNENPTIVYSDFIDDLHSLIRKSAGGPAGRGEQLLHDFRCRLVQDQVFNPLPSDNISKMQWLEERCYEMQMELADMRAQKEGLHDGSRKREGHRRYQDYSVTRYNSSLMDIDSDEDGSYYSSKTNAMMIEAALSEKVSEDLPIHVDWVMCEFCGTKGHSCDQCNIRTKDGKLSIPALAALHGEKGEIRWRNILENGCLKNHQNQAEEIQALRNKVARLAEAKAWPSHIQNNYSSYDAPQRYNNNNSGRGNFNGGRNNSQAAGRSPYHGNNSNKSYHQYSVGGRNSQYNNGNHNNSNSNQAIVQPASEVPRLMNAPVNAPISDRVTRVDTPTHLRPAGAPNNSNSNSNGNRSNVTTPNTGNK